jgi:hypothetical protein
MRKALVILMLFLAMPAWSDASTLTLDCAAAMNTTNEKVAEARLLSATHGMARRLSEPVLQLSVAGRLLTFRDVPSDEALMDLSYTFCGSREGYSLIGKSNGTLFTGELIEEKSGHVLPGGLQVIFSPDRRAYLAVEQENGIDGTDWTIHYADSGKISWKGYSFIASTNPSIELENPRWTEKGEFIATAHCWEDVPDTTARLINVSGKWRWAVPKTARQRQDRPPW